MIADRVTTKYFNDLNARTSELYSIAEKARSAGLDPLDRVEIYKAEDLASRVEGLIGVKGAAERIRELDRQMTREQTSFTIIEDIINGKFGKYDDKKAADYAMRTALAIVTEGITAAPLQGIDRVEIKENMDGTKYLAVYYAGPMRSAGGTEQALTVLFAEKIRKLLHLDRFKITEQEIGRFIEELRLYERKVSNFQYHPSDDDLRRLLPYIPIEITGPATDNYQVSVYRNIPRIETNSVRGGALRVINDGVYGKATKLKKIVDKSGFAGWDWLTKVKKEEKKENISIKIVPDIKYLVDIVGGRPIFSHPSRFGGFRLRYGRARNTGLACVGIHPASMIILESFIAVGTQLRVERPGKSATITPVDTIEGPIVKLNNGDVIRVEDEETAERVHDQVAEILFIGDMAIAVGEFLENNHRLMPAGYCEEIWAAEFKKAIKEQLKGSYKLAADKLGMIEEGIRTFVEKALFVKPTSEEALKISELLAVPLHPRYTYFWEALTIDELIELKDWIAEPLKVWKGGSLEVELKDRRIKELLEKIGAPHKYNAASNSIVFEDGPIIKALLSPLQRKPSKPEDDSIKFLSESSCIKIREKGRSFIGARMGRPEKARERLMSPPTHVLFPVGLVGGAKRDLTKAASAGNYITSIIIRRCPDCHKITFENVCSDCEVKTVQAYTCVHCETRSYFSFKDQDETTARSCPNCGSAASLFDERSISMQHYKGLLSKYNVDKNIVVKGVKGLSNPTKVPEPIDKGILRGKHKVFVYKDGTVRFDITNAPLTHFKVSETRISIEKLRELGYEKDCLGKELVAPDQIVELKVQDVIVPERCREYLFRASKYVDEMLKELYKMDPYYRYETEEDLVGALVIGLAPHTSAGIIGRIIGFTEAAVCYAHPFWHAAKRRNCDGDEDAVMLTLEALIDFSKAYLPDKIGGLMDAPLVVTTVIDPSEVDDECHNMETAESLPLEFYALGNEYREAKEALKYVDTMKERLGKPEQYTTFYYPIETASIEGGPLTTAYDKIKSMMDKVEKQLQLADRIKAVDSRDVAERLLKHHFIPDLAGNLRAFSTQTVRCTKCGAKYRRVPLRGVCTRCKGKLILTVHEGNVNKYLKAAFTLSKQYQLGTFVQQQIRLIEKGLRTLISEKEEEVKDGKEKERKKDMELSQFF